MMFLEQVTASVLSERRVFSGYGLYGGECGKMGKNTLIDLEGVEKNIGSKNTFEVRPYQRVRIETPGGGGYGVVNSEK